MDQLVLPQLAAELDERLRGRRIDQVYALPKNDVVLVAGRRSGPRLWFSTEPEHPHVYLRDGGHPTPSRPPGFAMAARNFLRGRPIESIRAVPGERVIELRCIGDEGLRLVFELIPRRATILVVDKTGLVRAAWQARRGRPELGALYTPPAGDGRPDIDDVEAATWAELALIADFDPLARALLRSVGGTTPLVAREIAFAALTGGDLHDHAAAQLARAAGPDIAPCVYAPGPLQELREPPTARNFVLSRYPLQHLEAASDLTRTDFADLTSAAAAYFPLRASLKWKHSARVTLGSALLANIKRVQRAHDAVVGDAAGAGKPERHRMSADLLLAFPTAARVGNIVSVADPYAGADDTVDIVVDPSRSNIDNAQTYYRRARRAERSATRTAKRRAQLQARIEQLRLLHTQLDAADDAASIAKIGRAAKKRGVSVTVDPVAMPEGITRATTWPDDRSAAEATHAVAPARRAEPAAEYGTGGDRPAPPRDPGIDAYTASDGSQVFVGRNARANEVLTHKIAAPDDFWLHAEGPGSHVVIRNPRRTAEPGEDALREAASLAAYFSRSRGATKVNVHWTQARHVKKPRGAPTGQVVLRRSKTILARPEAPSELLSADRNES